MSYISNKEIMDIFKEIEILKESGQTKKIEELKNKITLSMSFIINSMSKRYKKFSNYEDIKQEGFIGLMKAIDRFDYKRFPNFFVYSNQWIFNHIAQTAKKYDVVYNPNKKKVVYCDFNLTDTELDLDACPEAIYYKKEVLENINKAIGKLTQREQKVIRKTYGINTKPGTLRDIGKEIGITHERVRQIQNETIKKLISDENITNANDLSRDLCVLK